METILQLPFDHIIVMHTAASDWSAHGVPARWPGGPPLPTHHYHHHAILNSPPPHGSRSSGYNTYSAMQPTPLSYSHASPSSGYTQRDAYTIPAATSRHLESPYGPTSHPLTAVAKGGSSFSAHHYGVAPFAQSKGASGSSSILTSPSSAPHEHIGNGNDNRGEKGQTVLLALATLRSEVTSLTSEWRGLRAAAHLSLNLPSGGGGEEGALVAGTFSSPSQSSGLPLPQGMAGHAEAAAGSGGWGRYYQEMLLREGRAAAVGGGPIGGGRHASSSLAFSPRRDSLLRGQQLDVLSPLSVTASLASPLPISTHKIAPLHVSSSAHVTSPPSSQWQKSWASPAAAAASSAVPPSSSCAISQASALAASFGHFSSLRALVMRRDRLAAAAREIERTELGLALNSQSSQPPAAAAAPAAAPLPEPFHDLLSVSSSRANNNSLHMAQQIVGNHRHIDHRGHSLSFASPAFARSHHTAYAAVANSSGAIAAAADGQSVCDPSPPIPKDGQPLPLLPSVDPKYFSREMRVVSEAMATMRDEMATLGRALLTAIGAPPPTTTSPPSVTAAAAERGVDISTTGTANAATINGSSANAHKSDVGGGTLHQKGDVNSSANTDTPYNAFAGNDSAFLRSFGLSDDTAAEVLLAAGGLTQQTSAPATSSAAAPVPLAQSRRLPSAIMADSLPVPSLRGPASTARRMDGNAKLSAAPEGLPASFYEMSLAVVASERAKDAAQRRQWGIVDDDEAAKEKEKAALATPISGEAPTPPTTAIAAPVATAASVTQRTATHAEGSESAHNNSAPSSTSTEVPVVDKHVATEPAAVVADAEDSPMNSGGLVTPPELPSAAFSSSHPNLSHAYQYSGGYDYEEEDPAKKENKAREPAIGEEEKGTALHVPLGLDTDGAEAKNHPSASDAKESSALVSPLRTANASPSPAPAPAEAAAGGSEKEAGTPSPPTRKQVLLVLPAEEGASAAGAAIPTSSGEAAGGTAEGGVGVPPSAEAVVAALLTDNDYASTFDARLKLYTEALLREGAWVAHTKEGSGRPYYAKKGSKETVWDMLKALRQEFVDACVASLLTRRVWALVPAAGAGKKPYYYNKATKATCWDLAKWVEGH